MYDAVLVATDGSDLASRAVEYAIDLASTCGATLYALSIVDSRPLESARHSEQMIAAAGPLVEAVRERAERADLRVVTEVKTGVPHQAILDYADEAGADVVILGVTGRGGVERFLLGSTADRVLRLSSVPVLLVPAQAPKPS